MESGCSDGWTDVGYIYASHLLVCGKGDDLKALPQVKRYSPAELVRAMELLFQCNQRLVSSRLDESLVLQQTLVQIVGGKA